MLFVWVVYFSRVRRETVCARVQDSVDMYLCGSACRTGQMVLLYSAEARGIHSPGQMGRDSFASEVAE